MRDTVKNSFNDAFFIGRLENKAFLNDAKTISHFQETIDYS